MGPGAGGPGDERAHATAWVGETLLAAVVFAVAMGATWLSHGRGDGGSDVLVGSPDTDDSGSGDATPSEPPPGRSGDPAAGDDRTATATTVIIDPETGEAVVLTVPPGATVVDGEVVPDPGTDPQDTAPPGESPGGSPTTSPPTTGAPVTTTTAPTTTTVPDEPTTTTTTETTTTTTATTVP
jgi:hypothetical protein